MELLCKNIVSLVFGRMGGRTTGFVANQPLEMAGVLDVTLLIKLHDSSAMRCI